MRILITGANGFVGKHLLISVQNVFGAVAKIAAWDVLLENQLSESIPVEWFNVDITNASKVEKAIEQFRPTHVIHLAAISHVPTALKYPLKTWEVNVLGTLNLMEALKKYYPKSIVVYISSGEVYGTSFKTQEGVAEDSLLQPRNHYAASKAAADLMVGQYAEQGMPVIRLRPFNHTGQGQSEDFVISSFAAQIARIEQRLQDPVIHVGNLNSKRDFLDVDDVIAAYLKTLQFGKELSSASNGLILNISSGTARMVKDILDALLSYSTEEIEVRRDPARMRVADIPVAFGINANAIDKLGWKPQVLWEDTLMKVLNYWRTKVSNDSIASN